MIPPRDPNDKERPLPVHKHININGPKGEPMSSDQLTRETKHLASAIDRLNAERHIETGAYCFAIGLLFGILFAWMVT